jgi:hypothetical protein
MRKLKTFAMVAVISTPTLALAAGLRDYSSHKPPSITLPSAGGSYVDPVFGTKIIRVTDSRYGTRCVHAYSYWRAFNADNSRLLLECDNVGTLFRFDPSTDKVTYDGTLRGSDGYKLASESAIWSNTYSNTIYALDAVGLRIWRLDVANRGLGGYTKLKDFSGTLSSSLYITHLTVSHNGQIFSFHTRNRSTGERMNAYAWDRSTNKLYKFPTYSGLDVNESKVDKDGQWVMINYDDDTVALWDFRLGIKKWFQHEDLSDNVSGHFDVGSDFIANTDTVRTGLVVRTYGSLYSPQNIVRYKRPSGSDNWSIAEHVSLRSDPEVWAVGSTYAGDNTWAAFEDEIFLAALDGSGFVRLAHSRSKESNSSSSLRYYAQPRASASKNGRYIVYSSDLGSTTRFDTMILKVPSAYWPD